MAPRNVRNFWLELEVDGKKTKVATGPVRKDGGFVLTVKQRNIGSVMYSGELVGQANAKGELSLFWNPHGGDKPKETCLGSFILAETER